jgi:hypothetical protein
MDYKSGVNDFVEYWAVGRLLLSRENPYSPARLLELQTSVGWTESQPLVMWNPPWATIFVLPFGFLPYSIAQVLWLLLNVTLMVVATSHLWQIYRQRNEGHQLAWLLSFTFIPVPLALLFGQISGLVLFGIAQFLRMEQRKSWIAMGATTILISIKPHPVYLFWIALLLWTIKERQFYVALGAFIAFAIGTAVPLVLSPNLITAYLALPSNPAVINPFDLDTPALGRVLRKLLTAESPAVQFLPSLTGIAWLLVHRHRQRHIWNWNEELPRILLVSITTAAFAWTYDLIVVVPALMQVAARMFRKGKPSFVLYAAVIYTFITGIYWMSKLFLRADFWSFWLSPVLLLTYLFFRNHSPNPTLNSD